MSSTPKPVSDCIRTNVELRISTTVPNGFTSTTYARFVAKPNQKGTISQQFLLWPRNRGRLSPLLAKAISHMGNGDVAAEANVDIGAWACGRAGCSRPP